MTLVHPRYPPLELRRAGATRWLTNSVTFTPTLDPPGSVAAAATVASGTGLATMQYVVTAIESFTLTESLSSDRGATPAATLTAITQDPNGGVFTTALAHGLTAGGYVQISDVLGMVPVNNAIYPVYSTPTATTFVLGTWATTYDEAGSPTQYLIPLDTSGFPAYTGGGKVRSTSVSGDPVPNVGVASCSNNLATSGNYNTITWAAVTNAVRYHVYKLSNGLFGYIGQTSGLSFVDNNITADVSRTPPMQDNVMSAQNDYPAAVCYYEQRRMFAGSNNQPQYIWGTRSGTESNMNYHIPVVDDDRLAFRIAAREASAIRHLVPVTNLIALTASTEWRISTDSGPLTPTDINVKAQSYIGASGVTPVAVGTTVLFAQSRGGRIRELSYSWEASGYKSQDLSILAPHLFDATNIVDMAFSRAPHPMLWCVTAYGKMLGMTYVPEQQVAAWHQHDTGDGDLFESVCAISETPPGSIAAEDMVYVIVRRVVNGTAVRYVERIHSRAFQRQDDAWFLDCAASNFSEGTFVRAGSTVTCTVQAHGLSNGQVVSLEFSDDTMNGSYAITLADSNTFSVTVAGAAECSFGTLAVVPSSPQTTISIPWLVGRTIGVLADGAVLAPKVVPVGGTVTLEVAATKIIAGLPITADIQTLPTAVQIDPGFGMGRPMNTVRAWARVQSSSGLKVGPTFDSLREVKQRTTEPMGSPPALRSGILETLLDSKWSESGQVCYRHDVPLPMTIVSVTKEIAVGG